MAIQFKLCIKLCKSFNTHDSYFYFRIAKCVLQWIEIAGKELVAETCFKDFVAVSYTVKLIHIDVD